jgi:hypothetical protein
MEPVWREQLDLAGLGIDVRARGVGAARMLARVGNFVARSPRREPDVTLDVDVDARHASIGQPPDTHYPGCVGRFEPDGVITYQRSGLRMRFDPVGRSARAEACPTSDALALGVDPTPIDAPLRLLASYLLVERGGFLLHSSGYGDDRGAVVFAGVSGSGKTTTARKIAFDNVLSDDQVAVRCVDGAWRAHALPFVGEYARQPRARVATVRRVLLLRHGAAGARVRPLHRAVAVTRLLACVPWFVPNAPVARALLPLVTDVANAASVAELELGRDEPVRTLIEDWLSCPSA